MSPGNGGSDLSSKVNAAVLVTTRTMEIQAFDPPVINADDGLLKVELCGVCGSDPRIYNWTEPERFPLIMGHELVGHIEQLGSRAAARWGVQAGDRVIVEHLFGCGHCRWCLLGEYRFCKEHQGYGGTTPSSVPPHLWGAYSQYMYLAPNSRVHRISEDVPAEAAAMTCANIGNGLRWVRTKGGATIGDNVVVIGPGGQGLAAILAANEAGASKIIVVGLTQDQHRFELSRLFGATHIVNLELEDPVEAVLELTDGVLADLVVDLTGATASFPLALDLGATDGRCRRRVEHRRTGGRHRSQQDPDQGATRAGRKYARYAGSSRCHQDRRIAPLPHREDGHTSFPPGGGRDSSARGPEAKSSWMALSRA